MRKKQAFPINEAELQKARRRQVALAVCAIFFAVLSAFLFVCGVYHVPASLCAFLREHARLTAHIFFLSGIVSFVCAFLYNRSIMRSLTNVSRDILLFTHNLPGGIVKCKPTTGLEILFVSDGFLELIGYSRAEFAEQFGDSYTRLMYPADVERILAVLEREQAAPSGKPFLLSYRILTKSGEPLWVADNCALFQEESGESYYYCIILDDSVAKTSELQLRVRSESLRIALAHSRAHVFEFDPYTREFHFVLEQGEVQSLLPSYVENMPEDLIKSGLAAPATAAELRKAFAAIAGGAESAACTAEFIGESGSYWLSLKLTTVRDEYGAPLLAVTTVEDVSERVRVQQRYEDEKQYSQGMISSTLASTMFNLNTGIILGCHQPPGFETLLSEGDFIDDRLPELARRSVYLPDRADYIRSLNRRTLLDQYGAGTTRTSVEYRFELEDGTIAWRLLNVNMLADPHTGEPLAFTYLTDITERKCKELDLLRFAEHDSLTGLLNRRAFESRIADFFKTAESHASLHAFFMIDMDNFKLVNDTYGHMRGDEMLCLIAKCLCSTFRDTDIVARLAGDEFVVFMKNVNDSFRIEEKAREICYRMSGIRLEGADDLPPVSASIGVAIAPDAGTTFADLFAKADEAHYVAKRDGKGRYVIFEEPI